jgi:peptidoglycan/xylan/chitin deacetylase (PgdA/CDA1 family)
MHNLLVEQYKCPKEMACFRVEGQPGETPGYFRVDNGTIGFGRLTTKSPSNTVDTDLSHLTMGAAVRDSTCFLPFDPDEAITNLRLERYVNHSVLPTTGLRRLARNGYYALRPILPFAVRTALKRFLHRGWEQKAFPSWPLDRTADRTFEALLMHAMNTLGWERVPFIWFWPKGYSSCVVMTHDVETNEGIDFCADLMDMNDAYGVKSSFQIVPEERYAVPASLLKEMRDRGFEINVHDWNHDGRLFSDRSLFLTRVGGINQVAQQWGAEGFRAGALYRNVDWYDAFTLAYDMSVPNIGHLDPQPGGCCTLLPYFIGSMLEIPLTTVQDYMLFYMLGDYSIGLWKRQLEAIMEHNGLASFLVHPDYIIEDRARGVYTDLLGHLASIRSSRNVWIVPPREVNRWWRNRRQMTLTQEHGDWKIEGPGAEKACLAYAVRDGNRLVYELASESDKQLVKH